MSVKILFVDDEPKILEAYQRLLRKMFTMETAASASEALEMVEKHGPYAVILTDMQMPNMNGLEFLKLVSVRAPHSVRIMLTGNADQKTATDALNEGHIFRFLNKPCSPETMILTLRAGIEQYRLVTAEKELLEKTLIGSIGIMVDVLSSSEPQIFAHGKRLREYVHEVAGVLAYPNRWELEIAALLSQIGSLTIPRDIILKKRAQAEITAQEKALMGGIPESGRNLLLKIPRLESVAEIIRYQDMPYETCDSQMQPVSGENIPEGSRILKILSDLIDLEAGSMSRSVALRVLHTRAGMYDPQILDTLTAYYVPSLPLKDQKETVNNSKLISHDEHADFKGHNMGVPPSGAITLCELIVGDVLTSAVETSDGSVLLAAGNTVTAATIEKLTAFAQHKGIKEPIHVQVEQAADKQKAA